MEEAETTGGSKLSPQFAGASAAMFEDYQGEPGNSGETVFTLPGLVIDWDTLHAKFRPENSNRTRSSVSNSRRIGVTATMPTQNDD